MTSNLYTAAWTIIQNSCAAAVVAELLDDPLIAQHSKAAALRAAALIEVPESELIRIRELMAEEVRSGKLPRSGISRSVSDYWPNAVNANEPTPPSCARPGPVELGRAGRSDDRARPCDREDAPRTERG